MQYTIWKTSPKSLFVYNSAIQIKNSAYFFLCKHFNKILTQMSIAHCVTHSLMNIMNASNNTTRSFFTSMQLFKPPKYHNPTGIGRCVASNACCKSNFWHLKKLFCKVGKNVLTYNKTFFVIHSKT